jgi:outer membrane protein assembly factor BamB
MFDRIARIAFFIGLVGLSFLWGAATVRWKLPPYKFMNRVEAGVVAITKFEDKSLPNHVIRIVDPGTPVGAMQTLTDTPPDDLILMTGGFFYRMDLCPKFGCIAWIMDRSGNVLHTWEYDPAALFTKESLKGFSGFPGADNINVLGASLSPDGGLVVTFQGRNIFPYQVGVGKFAWAGTLDWLQVNRAHHWPEVGPDGRVYVPIAKIEGGKGNIAKTTEPIDCKFGAVFQEGVAVLSPAGETLKEFWMEDVVAASDRQGIAYSVRDDCDPFHVNSVALLNAAGAARLPGTRTGDLVVSLRSSSSVVIMDQDDGTIRRIVTGPMVAQHSPRVLPNGDLAVFDNLGGLDTQNGTRIIEVDIATGAGKRLFPRDNAAVGGDLKSIAQGVVRMSPDGTRGLISETLNGRVIEFDLASGAPLWTYAAVSDMAPFYAWKGEPKTAPVLALMQTQGADYIPRETFDRLNAGG